LHAQRELFLVTSVQARPALRALDSSAAPQHELATGEAFEARAAAERLQLLLERSI
jgi:hypothetical protein